MVHSAILPSPQHAAIVLNTLPARNPQVAVSAVMIHNVSFDEASKITAQIAAQGLSPLDWDPPITRPAEPAPAPPAPIPEPEPSPSPPAEPSPST